jgi:hypothetical protein
MGEDVSPFIPGPQLVRVAHRGRALAQLYRVSDTTAGWVSISLSLSLVSVAVVFAIAGTGYDGIQASLLVSARFAFLMFLAAYAGAPLTSVFGSMFQPLRSRGRDFGLAFAAILTVHLSLVAWLCILGSPPSLRTFVVFGIAAAFAYLLAIFSSSRVRRAVLPSRGWNILRSLGMNYIALVFALDFVRQREFFGLVGGVEYWPFAVLALAALGLRILTAVHGWRTRAVQRSQLG